MESCAGVCDIVSPVNTPVAPFTWINFNLSMDIHYKVWNEITYLFLNLQLLEYR